jgi:hypothetical protein
LVKPVFACSIFEDYCKNRFTKRGITTHMLTAGKMPGLIPSMGAVEFLIGPATARTAVEDAASSGQKIYSSQTECLAGEAAGQVANYLSQYSAGEGWIPWCKAKSVKLAAE